MSQPSITDALEVNGSSATTTTLITDFTSVYDELGTAESNGKLGGSSGSAVSTVVLNQLRDELIDLAERIGQNLST